MKFFEGVAVLAVVVAFVVVPGELATAAPIVSAEVPIDQPGEAGPEMGDYPAADFIDEVEALPVPLTEAIERDLGIEAEEYLARSEAAVDATAVLEFLGDQGTTVLGSSLDGTTLVVNVESTGDVAAIESVGAVAVVGAPEVVEFDASRFRLTEDLLGGQGYIYVSGSSVYQCSLGFLGYRISDGRSQASTAGHCTSATLGNSGYYTKLNQLAPNVDAAVPSGTNIGKPVTGSFRLGSGNDGGLLDITTGIGWSPQARVDTWGGGSGAPNINSLDVTDRTFAIVGAPVCKSGSVSGWTCGEVLAVDTELDVGDGASGSVSINLIITSACVLRGDSGGTALSGGTAIGITSASTWDASAGNGCEITGGNFSGFFPMISALSTKASMAKLFSTIWEPGVTLSTPAVTSPAAAATVPWGSTMTGTLPNGNDRHRAEVRVDGGAVITAKVNSSGQWSASLAGLAPGAHSYTVEARWGTWSKSTVVNGTFTLAPVAVSRLSGGDRYEVGVSVSKALYPNPVGDVPVVYIADGANFPDALSAAPAAVRQGGPLLLTRSSELPSFVRDEIVRLDPANVVIVGGPASVSAAVFNSIAAIVGSANVTRLGGSDRYAASRSVVDHAWKVGSELMPVVYVTTGENYPDAISASAAAGAIGAPVILVPGSQSTLDAATKALLDSINPTTIKIAGGSVSAGIATQLQAYGTVVRLGGADRFSASQTINRDAFTSSSTVYLTTGFNYPDGLVGAALAGKRGSPLYSVHTTCIPSQTLVDIAMLKPTEIVLFGGPATLTQNVFALKTC